MRTAQMQNKCPNISTTAGWKLASFKVDLLAIPNCSSWNACSLSAQWLLLFWDQKVRGPAIQYKVCHPLHEGVVNRRSGPFNALCTACSRGWRHTGRTWKRWKASQPHQSARWDLHIPVGCEKATGAHQQTSGLSSSYQTGLWAYCEAIYQPKKS